jgi:hypothetical protein
MFARKQKSCTASPVDAPSQCLRDSLLEKSNTTKYRKVHQEDSSHVVNGSPVLANIESSSFLLGLLIGVFIEANAFSANILTLALFGDDADPRMVTIVSTILTCSFTCVISILCFFHALDRLMYLLEVSVDTSEEIERSIIWHITCRFGLGSLIGLCSAWVIVDLCYYTFIGLDRGRIEFHVSMLVGATMLSLIMQCWSSNKYRHVTRVGSLVESNEFAETPVSSSTNKHVTIDPVQIPCASEVHIDALVSIV